MQKQPRLLSVSNARPGSLCSSLRRCVLFVALSAAGACSSGSGTSAPPHSDLAQPPPSGDLAGPAVPADLAAPPSLLSLLHLGRGEVTQRVLQVAVDPSGNLIVGCEFSGTADFGDGLRLGKGRLDVAVLKLKPTGEVLWARHLGGPEQESIDRLAVDSTGAVIAAGTFSQTVDFGGVTLTSAGGADLYLIKYESDGRLAWVKGIGTPNSESGNHGIAVDRSDNIYYTGNVWDAPINLGGGPLPPAGYRDLVLAKFTPGGAHLFSKRMGGSGLDAARSLALAANGDVLIGGELNGTVDLGGGAMTPAGRDQSWAFVARYDGAGTFRWAQSYSDANTIVSDLAVTPEGDVVALGSFVDLLQTRTALLDAPTATRRAFLLQLDAAGTEKWARQVVSGSIFDTPRALAVDARQIYVGGMFEGTGDVGLGPRTALGFDGYVVGYSHSGQPRWTRQYGGSYGDWITTLAPRPDGLYVGGWFSATVDFDGTPLTSSGDDDGFLLKLPPQP